jgi:hypothetical protein
MEVMNNTKIYIVTSGSYSDYHIAGVFSDMSVAKEFADKYSPYESDVEMYDLDVPKSSWTVKTVTMDRHGNVINIYDRICELKDIDNVFIPRIDRDGYIVINVRTDDDKTAIKVANENRTCMIAEGIFDKHMD